MRVLTTGQKLRAISLWNDGEREELDAYAKIIRNEQNADDFEQFRHSLTVLNEYGQFGSHGELF